MALKSGRVGIHPSQVDPITGMLLSGPSGTSDYEQLSNLPKVNSVTLKGNKSLSDLGIPTSLAGQSDTDITNPANGEILQYNGTSWENASVTPGSSTLAALTDVTITDPAAGQTLEYNGTGWENVFASIAPTTLAALQDVDITSPADGDYLVYDGTNHEWVNSGSAPTPTYTDVTCTFYGAVEDIISFTDAAGVSHLVTFATDASSKQETFKIDPSGSSITFISSVAKNPDNLSASYSKTVTITSEITSIYVMPNENVLYWWGYESSDLEDVTTANGWSRANYSFSAPVHNKNSITCTGANNTYSNVGTKTSKSDITMYVVATGTTAASSRYGDLCEYSSKSSLSQQVAVTNFEQSAMTKYSLSVTNGYVATGSAQIRKSDLYAIWYE